MASALTSAIPYRKCRFIILFTSLPFNFFLVSSFIIQDVSAKSHTRLLHIHFTYIRHTVYIW